MKKILLLLLAVLTMGGCGGTAQDKTSAEPDKVASADKMPVASASGKKILIAYFSRTGEEYNVGTITRGNTAIVADFIAQKTGADVFEIKPAAPYPDDYNACTELAKKELESNARPALANKLDNLAQYDTIFLGYPIWWGKMPMIVYTFLESGDFGGKKIIPFCTHGGSGLAGTEHDLGKICPNAKVLSGLAIVGKRAQNDSAGVQKDVNQWLSGLGY